MNTNQGIFETFPHSPGSQKDSPFSVAGDAGNPSSARTSPFAAMDKPHSPFTMVDEGGEAGPPEPGKPAKLPERRSPESPFQMAEPSEGFGFEAPPHQGGFEAPAAAPQTPRPAVEPAFAPPFGVAPHFPAPAFAGTAAFAPVSSTAAVARPESGDFLSDSSSIRQLELRAIFGVDRELGTDEILHLARALPGIRSITRVGAREVATIEGLKNLLPSLGLPGPLKLYAGATPVEFIREGPVVLAVLADGGFAPGVREKLMIVARELGRLG